MYIYIYIYISIERERETERERERCIGAPPAKVPLPRRGHPEQALIGDRETT